MRLLRFGGERAARCAPIDVGDDGSGAKSDVTGNKTRGGQGTVASLPLGPRSFFGSCSHADSLGCNVDGGATAVCRATAELRVGRVGNGRGQDGRTEKPVSNSPAARRAACNTVSGRAADGDCRRESKGVGGPDWCVCLGRCYGRSGTVGSFFSASLLLLLPLRHCELIYSIWSCCIWRAVAGCVVA